MDKPPSCQALRSALTVQFVLAAMLLAACGGAAAGGTAPERGAALPPATVIDLAPATQAPAAGPTAEAMAPTITVNPHLHATNPETVKLASGAEPTLVEFFAFW